jgi:ATP phosphoribosyltransferase
MCYKKDISDASVLRFGVPSKGRLYDSTIEAFEGAGFPVIRGQNDRSYVGYLKGFSGVELVFLRATEIVQRLDSGEIHLGITGKDLVKEQQWDWCEHVELLLPMNFGHAKVVVAVPKFWFDISCMADLDDFAADLRVQRDVPMRVATKYSRLTRKFFRKVGLINYALVNTQGSTECLPAMGACEIIVDIVSSGRTLRENRLKILDDGEVLESEAYFCASVHSRARWTDENLSILRNILAFFDSIGGADEIFQRFEKVYSVR